MPEPGRAYTDRFPETRGKMLWCAGLWCGRDCPAEELSWGQECPSCAQWWIDNPPPGEEQAMIPAQVPPTLTPQQANTRSEELRTALKLHDTQSAVDRNLLDNQARARDYRGMEKTATEVAAKAKNAALNAADLDTLQEAINQATKKKG